MDNSPGAEHVSFTQWALSHGIKIRGVAPARFPGRRLGMIATRTIGKNEIMLAIPISLMLTIDSIPKPFVSLFPQGTPIQGILAAFLTHGDQTLLSELDAWRRVWPAWEEFEQSMPIFWPAQFRVSNSPPSLQNGRTSARNTESISRDHIFLPPSISGLWNSSEKKPESPLNTSYKYETRYQNILAQQEKRLQDAWGPVRSAFPETDWNSFVYNWAIINSRSFYYVSPEEEEPEDWNDAIAMVPFADYFNHADDAACDVTFDGEKYTFKAMRRYEKGEEIYMSYGAHSNDFLLVEYGFCLDHNPSDGIYLDDIILGDLTTSEKKELEEQGCLGNFQVKASGPDTNTIAAAAIKHMDRQDWRNFISDMSRKGFGGRKTADIISGWIKMYLRECTITIKFLMEVSKTRSAESETDKEKLDMLLARWKQIQQLCEKVLQATTE
ncbi:hypothetical protein BJX76DRAFT_250002 [Aspergillus varians]